MLTIITIIKISPNIHDNNPSSQRGCGFETGLRRDEVASTFTVIILILIISIIIMKPEYIQTDLTLSKDISLLKDILICNTKFQGQLQMLMLARS